MKNVYKDKYCGWVVEDTIKLNDKLVLDIRTRKLNGKLKTTAQVSHLKDGFKSFFMFQDFYKVYLDNTVSRITEKAVRTQHDWFDTSIAVNEAKQFYGVE